MPFRVLSVLALLVAFQSVSYARTGLEPARNSLGMRLTGLRGAGAELSYQRATGASTRLEVDLGMRAYDYSATLERLYVTPMAAVSFQWHWDIGGDFGTYAGPAAQYAPDCFGICIGAQTGFDWHADGPFMLSLDVRPTINLFADIDVCLSFGVRYCF